MLEKKFIDYNKSLLTYKEVKFQDIKNDEFVQDLLKKCLKNNILSKEEVDYINFGISKVLNKQLIYFTKNESTSTNIDIAQNLLMSVYFTISISLKRNENILEIITRIKEDSIESIFKDGQEIIKMKFFKCRLILESIYKNKININNYAYIDTIDYGLGAFFKKYDYFFKAHEVPITLDYPLSDNVFSYIGIERIERYLINLNFENKFCNLFNENEIKKLLYSYSDNSEEILLNIFNIVLVNSFGSFVIGKDFKNLNIKEYEKEIILNNIGNHELLYKYLNDYMGVIKNNLNVNDKEFFQYIKKALEKLFVLLKISYKNKTFKEQFVTFKNEKQEILQYKSYKKLSNDEFRSIYEEIIILENVNDKISLLKEKIKNIDDIVDILSSECFMDNEYIILFSSLDYFEIALIIAYIPDIFSYVMYEEKWQIKFNEYFLNLKPEIQNKIKEVSRKISF